MLINQYAAKQEIFQERRTITAFLERKLSTLINEICSSTDGSPNIGNLPPVLGADLLAEAQCALDISSLVMAERHGIYPVRPIVNASTGIMPTLEEMRQY